MSGLKIKSWDGYPVLYRGHAAKSEDVTNVSNGSNAFYAGRFYEESARDARMCIDMDPKFAKGYYRLAYALKDMGKMMKLWQRWKRA